MNGYWLVVRSDKKVIVVDDPERVYSIGRNAELPAAQQLHHKYISREHLRLRYASPSLLVFQIGKNPTFYGTECHRVPGKSDNVNEKVKLEVVEHDKEEQFTLQTIANTRASEINKNTNDARNSLNFHHGANGKDYDNAVDDHQDYSKALVFCVSAGKEDCINESIVCKEEKQHSLTEKTQANSITMESKNHNGTNDDNIVYVDAMQCESAHNAPERECIDQSTLYFPDELHLPTLTVRYVQGKQVNSNNKQNEHIATTPTEIKNIAVNSESTINSVHENDVDKITATLQRSAPTPAQMLAVPILKNEEEEEEEEEQLIGDANHDALMPVKHSTNEDNSQINMTLLSEKKNNDNNDNNLFTEGDSRAHEYRKEWQGLLNEAMKEEQQRLAELKEQESKELNDEEQEEWETGNNCTSHVCNSKDEPTQISSSSSSKNKTIANGKELTYTRTPFNHTSNTNTTQCEASIPFGSSSAKYKNVKQKESDITQNTSTRKRPRLSTNRRGRGGRYRGNSTSSSSSESSASLSEESTSESESSFTSTSSSYDDDDDDESSTSSESSESSFSKERVN